MELICEETTENYRIYPNSMDELMDDEVDGIELASGGCIKSFPDPALTCDVRVLSNILNNCRSCIFLASKFKKNQPLCTEKLVI